MRRWRQRSFACAHLIQEETPTSAWSNSHSGCRRHTMWRTRIPPFGHSAGCAWWTLSNTCGERGRSHRSWYGLSWYSYLKGPQTTGHRTTGDPMEGVRGAHRHLSKSQSPVPLCPPQFPVRKRGGDGYNGAEYHATSIQLRPRPPLPGLP